MREILTQKEIEKLLFEGTIAELHVKKKIDDERFECEITYLPPQQKSIWKIDVWNCHGVLKKAEWELGYGSKTEDEEIKWEDVGWFTIPLKKSARITKKERKKIEEILANALESVGGAINWSGFYPFYEIDKIKKILEERLYDKGGEK